MLAFADLGFTLNIILVYALQATHPVIFAIRLNHCMEASSLSFYPELFLPPWAWVLSCYVGFGLNYNLCQSQTGRDGVEEPSVSQNLKNWERQQWHLKKMMKYEHLSCVWCYNPYGITFISSSDVVVWNPESGSFQIHHNLTVLVLSPIPILIFVIIYTWVSL